MVFFSIRVGTYNIRYSPFSEDDETYPICDKDKNVLEYVKGTNVRGYYVNPTTKEKVENTFMLVNGEPKDKFEKTKETDRFKIVENQEANDLVNPKMYLVECDRLKEELRTSGKSLKFGFSNGGKSKPYFAIICLNPIFNTLEMWISKTKKSEQYTEYTNGLQDKAKLKEMTLMIDGIDKAKVEDLIEL
jgi:hypothetical protein